MQLNNTETSGKKFLSILADGKFHQTVADGTEGAVVREYEDKDGKEQSKTELVFGEVEGLITEISFDESDYGKNLIIEIDGEGEIKIGTASNFGEDLLKKIPSIDKSKPVKLVPYSFTDDKGKTRKGVTVYQDDKKVENYYYDSVNKKAINGIPQAEGDTSKFDKDDWKMYFMKVRKFLINQVEGGKEDNTQTNTLENF